MFIGIDFGTSNSVFSIYSNHDIVRIGNRETLTQIRYKDPNFLIGKECKFLEYPDDTVINIKASIRKKGAMCSDLQIKSGNRVFSHQTLIQEFLSAFIKKIIETLEDTDSTLASETIEGIVVTVPCGFVPERAMTRSEYSKTIKDGVAKAYKDAIEEGVLVGIKDEQGEKQSDVPIRVIEEPVAAAVQYFASPNGRNALSYKQKMKVLVADLGGGTFDLTIMEYDQESNCYKVLDTDGDLLLGGNDWDDALFDLAKKKYKEEKPDFHINDENRLSDLYYTKEAKEGLTKQPYQTIQFKGDETGVRVTCEEFEDATKQLLERMKTIIKTNIEKNGGIESIDKIVLVGGACKMPQIRNGIKSLFPNYADEDIFTLEPLYAIANGAARCAMMEDIKVEFIRIATCSYGFRYYDIGYKKDYIKNLIVKGAQYNNGKIVGRVECPHRAREAKQEAVNFIVYENQEILHKFEFSDAKTNCTNLKVVVDIPEKYWKKRESQKYDLYPKMTLTSDGILILEVYDENGKLVGTNEKKLGE